MALETGTFTNDLVPTNPVANDGVGQGDDHIRLIKNSLKNTFAGFTSVALASSQAQLDAAVAVASGASAYAFKAGTVLLPGLAPTGNANTGIYQPATNQIGISVGGVASALFSSTGLGVTGNVTASGGIAGAAVAATGAFSGGTGQLVPIGASLIWHEDALPAEGGYCWANGGTLSRSAYPLLWARWGTKYGPGDGTTTFNVPNLCEMVPVGQRAMGGAASRAFLATGVLGAGAFGSGTATLLTANLPPYTPSGSVGSITVNSTSGFTSFAGNVNVAAGGNPIPIPNGGNSTVTSTGSGAFTGSAQGGTSTPFAIVQPSTAVNFIIRIG